MQGMTRRTFRASPLCSLEMSALTVPIDFQISVAKILGQTLCSQLSELFEKSLKQFSGPISSYLQECEEIRGGSVGREKMRCG